ncbi:hypothetical protein ACIQU5_36140 [Streptomyces sp. NPDC090306]|uniref:hypothetical protein n=1 Tax=Streptomyces sp. NPDC090306 TaxID=3365961 RepID=UPI0037F125BC
MQQLTKRVLESALTDVGPVEVRQDHTTTPGPASAGEETMAQWAEGDKVTPVVPTDHPEDLVGEVVMITANGGVMVKFPLAGAEVYPSDELTRAPSEGE